MPCRRFPLRHRRKQQYHFIITIEINVLHVRMFLNQPKKRRFFGRIFVRASPYFSVQVRIFPVSFPVSRFFAALCNGRLSCGLFTYRLQGESKKPGRQFLHFHRLVFKEDMGVKIRRQFR